jgi:flagellar protein FliO/FliZ
MDSMLALRAIGSLLVVLGLLGGCAVLLRRYGHKITGLTFAPSTGAKARLLVVETRLVDARSKLVLVRRDGTEHLLLISQAGACVIETQIQAEPAA